jgi:hypothetical protein
MRLFTINFVALVLQITGRIKVWNNGSGVPVEMHKKEKVYVPELIFGHLLTSSNYEDDQKKVWRCFWTSCCSWSAVQHTTGMLGLCACMTILWFQSGMCMFPPVAVYTYVGMRSIKSYIALSCVPRNEATQQMVKLLCCTKLCCAEAEQPILQSWVNLRWSC